MIVEEMFYRSGGLVPINPILSEELMLHTGAITSTQMERRTGKAEEVLSKANLKKGDTIIISSNSGINVVPVEAALYAKKMGLTVICVTSCHISKQLEPRSETGMRLCDVGDIVIDNCHIYTTTLIGLREDYGSTWNGRILLKDVTIHNSAAETNLVYGQWYNHNFGYPTFMPSEIVIDGLTLTNPGDVNIFTKKFIEQSKNAVKDEIDGNPNVNKMAAPKSIVIKNNKNGYNFIGPDSPFFKDTVITVE